ncbi:DUF4158 domain-containing protein [Streptomyces sp. NPDC048297]|uniref:DUF4158 domain-containing protein n=1 Tax=Streptomyces sp. NPDC048297 TaxID=3365531 RepID=UPI0037231A5C
MREYGCGSTGAAGLGAGGPDRGLDATRRRHEEAAEQIRREPAGLRVVAEVLRGGGPVPGVRQEMPVAAVEYLAQQVKVPFEAWAAYDWQGRAIQRHRGEIRAAYGFRASTEEDQERLAQWLAAELCPVELSRERLAAVVARCRNDQIEPPAPKQVGRLVGKAVKDFEAQFCRGTLDRLGHATRSRLEDLVASGDGNGEGADGDGAVAGGGARISPS